MKMCSYYEIITRQTSKIFLKDTFLKEDAVDKNDFCFETNTGSYQYKLIKLIMHQFLDLEQLIITPILYTNSHLYYTENGTRIFIDML